MTPRFNAYIQAADPAWIEDSVRSYYELVQRIVVSYDESGRSWRGQPIPIRDCLERLKSVDPDGKLDFRPGDFARPDHSARENDTYQRQQALRQTSDGADWVIQLDTDEVVPNLDVFRESLLAADVGDCDVFVYPSRLLYQRIGRGLFLEQSTRFWRRMAGYPGPVAVRPGVELRLSRQGGTNVYAVGFSHGNLSLFFLPPTPVRTVIASDDAILHFSWIRSDEDMVAKLSRKWGLPSANSSDWSTRLRRWRRAAKHPLLAAALTPVRSSKSERVRISRIHGWETR